MRSQLEIDQIVQDVQHRLDVKRSATGIDLRVPPGGYTEGDSWLNIIVTPTTNGPAIRASQYVETLGDFERELRATGINGVLPVPAIN